MAPTPEPAAAALEVEIEIERLSPGGDGVGREPSGRVVFVPFTAPGDRVRVAIRESHPRFARGEVVERLVSSPARREPACAVFGTCGGCSWQHVTYDEQVEQKRGFVLDAFRRIAHLDPPEPIEVVPCPVEYGYRIRCRVAVEGGAVGYRRRRSRALCPTERCPVLVPELEQALSELPARARGRKGEWWLAAGSDGKVTAASAAARRQAAPRVRLEVSGRALECELGGFSQGNGPLFERVAEEVVSAAGRGEVAVELFAGAGYLTLGLAAGFARVLAVEGDRRATRDLARNRDHAGLAQVEIVETSVERALATPPVSTADPDVVVLDPPRTGLPAGCVEGLAALGAPRVVYLSCDPATLARDAARLHEQAYRLTRVRGYDLFPQTPHLEVMAVFARAGDPAGR